MAVHEVGYFRLRDFEDLGDARIYCSLISFAFMKDSKEL